MGWFIIPNKNKNPSLIMQAPMTARPFPQSPSVPTVNLWPWALRVFKGPVFTTMNLMPQPKEEKFSSLTTISLSTPGSVLPSQQTPIPNIWPHLPIKMPTDNLFSLFGILKEENVKLTSRFHPRTIRTSQKYFSTRILKTS
jgi:hypothetical protein